MDSLEGLTLGLVITTPMDFLTMSKKLKNKQYKSKREFKDDLDLIWSNCYKYNAEVRPACLVTSGIHCLISAL